MDSETSLLLEAMTEVTRTILVNPSFFPANDQQDVRDWVQKLFPDTPSSTLDSYFAEVVMNPELPWGKRRFFVPPVASTDSACDPSL